MGIFHACILAGSPEKVNKMDEKVSATDKCYRARGCLLKFRAHCETTERSVNMRSRQDARARRQREKEQQREAHASWGTDCT